MICRLCLRNCEHTLCLFDGNGDLRLLDLIHKYLFLEIDPDDIYSKNICKDCSHTLRDFDNFTQRVQKCQLSMHKMPIETVPATPDEDVIKETKKEFLENDDSDNDELPCADAAIENGNENGDNDSSLNESLTIKSYKNAQFPNADEEAVSCREIEKEEETTCDGFRSKMKSSNGPKENKRCLICSKEFSTARYLKAHMQRVHIEYIEQIDDRTCHLCCRVFSSIERAQIHERVKHNQKKEDLKDQTCPICSEVYETNWNMKIHMIRSHYEKTQALSNKKTHRYVLKNSTLADSATEIQENDPNEIEKANTLRDDDIEYRTCTICNESFPTIYQFRGHCSRSHRGLYPFKCMICNKKFPLKISFHKHLKSCNGTCSTEKVEYRKCPICFTLLLDIRSFKRHMRLLHTGVRPFACSNCKKSFAYLDEFEKHVSDEPAKCKNDIHLAELELYKSTIEMGQKNNKEKISEAERHRLYRKRKRAENAETESQYEITQPETRAQKDAIISKNHIERRNSDMLTKSLEFEDSETHNSINAEIKEETLSDIDEFVDE